MSTGLTGDDVHGMRRVYGVDPLYRNTYVSSQTLRGNTLVDNNIDPDTGNTYPDPLRVCPGDVVKFLSTVGNASTRPEELELVVYADADPTAYYFSPSDALGVFSVTLGNRGTGSVRTDFTIPSTLPTGVQNIFVSTRNLTPGERKGYDDSARSRLRIQRKSGC